MGTGIRRAAVSSRRVTLWGLALLVACSAAGCGRDDPNAIADPPESIVAQTAELNSQGRFDDTIRLLEGYLAEHPRTRLLHYNIAGLVAMKGDSARAIEHLRAEIAIQPCHTPSHLGLGQILEQLGDLEGSLESYRAVAECEPVNWRAHHGIGKLLVRLGRFDEARAPLDEARNLAPGEADPLVAIAQIHLENEDAEGAAELLARALDLAPDHLEAQSRYADTLERLGRAEEADGARRRLAEIEAREEELRQAQEQFGQASDPLAAGRAHFDAGRLEEAAVEFGVVAKDHPEMMEAHLLLGVVLTEMKRFEEAVDALDRAAGIEPEDYQTQLRLAHAHAGLKDKDQALRYLERARGLQELNADASRTTGVYLIHAGATSEGWKLLQDAVRLEPSDHETLFLMGSLLHRGNQAAEALPYYERAIRLQPGQPVYHVAWAMAQSLLGRGDSALSKLRELPPEAIRDGYARVRRFPASADFQSLVQEALAAG